MPDNDRKKRKQTSIVSVGVLPIPKEIGQDLLPDSEVETTTCGGSGPGGQHQNATDSAVRMRHIQTGIVVFINGRDQQSNRREAKKILSIRVRQHQQQLEDAAYGKLRKAQLGDGGRSDKIRTYNFVQSRVVDHRYNTKTSDIKSVMKGHFELLFPVNT